MSALSRIVARNSLFSLLGQVGIKALSLWFSIYVVRRLGSESYGQYTTVLAYVNIFAIFSDLGLAPYALREIARDRGQTSVLISNVILLRLILSLPTIALSVTAAVLAGRAPILVWGVLLSGCGLLLYAVQGPLDTLLMARERLDYSSAFSVVNQIAFVFLGTVALIAGAGVFGLITASLCGVLAAATLSLWVAQRRLGGFRWQVDPAIWPRLIRAALPFGVIGLMGGLSYRLSTVLLQYFHGDAVAGWYNAAYNLIFMLMTLSNALNISLYPSLVRQQVANPAGMAAIYNRVVKYMVVLSVPIAAGTTVLADKIVLLLYTEQFSAAILPLRILIWALPLMFLSNLVGNIVVIHNRERLVARALAVSTGINLILNVLLTPRFGLMAASLVTVLTEAVLVLQYLWVMHRELAQVDRRMAFIRPFLAAACMSGAAWALRNWNLFAVVAVAAVVYLAGILLLRVMDREELRSLWAMVGRRRETTTPE